MRVEILNAERSDVYESAVHDDAIHETRDMGVEKEFIKDAIDGRVRIRTDDWPL